MKIVNTVIITTLLSLGLAGNALAANSDYRLVQKHGAKHTVVSTQAYKKAVKKVAIKQTAKRVVVKKAAKRIYKVRSGDTLTRIAARNHVSVRKLIQINKLWGKKAHNLTIGMRIRLS